MNKNIRKKYLNTILTLILVSVLIVGCQGLGTINDANNEPNLTPKEVVDDKLSATERAELINEALEQFNTDRQLFISGLENAVTYKYNREQLEEISSRELIISLGTLKNAINYQSLTLDNPLKNTIDKIEAVITPARYGLTKKAIQQIQDEIFTSPPRDRPARKEEWYGKYGEGTKNKIGENLNDFNLALQIGNLVGTYNSEATEIEPENSENIDTLLGQKIEELNLKINELEKRVEQLSSPNNNNLLNRFLPSFASGFLGGISLLLLTFGYLFVESKLKPKSKKDSKARSKQITPQSSNTFPNEQPVFSHDYHLLNSRLQEVEEKLLKFKNQHNQLNVDEIVREIRRLENRLQIVERNKSSNTSSYESRSGLYTPQQDYTPQPVRQYRQPPLQPSHEPEPRSIVPSPPSNYSNLRLVQTYNRDAKSLLRNVTEVSETQESFSNRSVGKSTTVNLESKNRGIYAVIEEGNTNYLIPSRYFTITKNNYQTVEDLFECRGYQPSYSQDFKLVKPGVVRPLSGNQWQLQERGILEF